MGNLVKMVKVLVSNQEVVCFLVLAWLFSIVGFCLEVSMGFKFFARSGSLMVLFAIVSEYKLLKQEQERIYNLLKGRGAAQAGEKGIPDLAPVPKYKNQVRVAHVTVIIGTFIWGFGDYL